MAQLLTERPSSRIVHAPHWPVSQPTLVPVSPSSSRRKSARSTSAATVFSHNCPLTVTDTVTVSLILIVGSITYSPDRLNLIRGMQRTVRSEAADCPHLYNPGSVPRWCRRDRRSTRHAF